MILGSHTGSLNVTSTAAPSTITVTVAAGASHESDDSTSSSADAPDSIHTVGSDSGDNDGDPARSSSHNPGAWFITCTLPVSSGTNIVIATTHAGGSVGGTTVDAVVVGCNAVDCGAGLELGIGSGASTG